MYLLHTSVLGRSRSKYDELMINSSYIYNIYIIDWYSGGVYMVSVTNHKKLQPDMTKN